jgi:nucleotide sugar dehydrogenase
MKQKISIAGAGYVGLVTGICMAVDDFKVTVSNFKSPEIGKQIAHGVAKETLTVVDDLREAIQNTDITLICEGTPMQPDKSIDLQYIERTAKQIGEALKTKSGYHVVVVKSTVVPGTTRNLVGKLIEQISGKKRGDDFGLCMSPEFLREGSAIEDTVKTDRVIIGEYDKRSGKTLEQMYQDFYPKTTPILHMGLESAEMVKYASNAFLATKISYANELANICEVTSSVDIVEVVEGMGLDFRINKHFLGAGVGFGGSCFPKDVNAIRAFAKQQTIEPVLLDAVLTRNELQAVRVVDLLEELMGSVSGKRIALLGLAFKPGTDDMREAASIRIIDELRNRHVKNIVATDPVAIPAAKEVLKEQIESADTATKCIKDADGCILVTEWEEYKNLTPEHFISQMAEAVVVDGRRIFDPKVFGKKIKFRAIGLGLD